jgi:hypothetical protein
VWSQLYRLTFVHGLRNRSGNCNGTEKNRQEIKRPAGSAHANPPSADAQHFVDAYLNSIGK